MSPALSRAGFMLKWSIIGVAGFALLMAVIAVLSFLIVAFS